ncbi:MAG: terminase TerL endonuclease subunit, partial [Sphingomonadaceae bacterium]
DLVICARPEQDVAEIADLCASLWARGLLPEREGIGLDPYGVASLVDALAQRGIPDEAIAGVGQGWRLSGTIKGLERKLKDQKVAHCGQPLCAWAVSNASVDVQKMNLLITKERSGMAKIDPLAALINAVYMMDRNPQPRAAPESVYTRRGLLVV